MPKAVIEVSQANSPSFEEVEIPDVNNLDVDEGSLLVRASAAVIAVVPLSRVRTAKIVRD